VSTRFAPTILKILLLCLLPSCGLYAVVRREGLAERLFLGRIPIEILDKTARTCVWISVGMLGIAIVGYLLSPGRAAARRKPEPPALLRDLVRYGLFIILVAMTLRLIWGENVTPLLGALGIGGVVLGFALQETLSNFFAGLALLLEKPFAQGDWIRIGEKEEGVVEHITWRATKVRTRDNDYEIFPNSVVAKEVIVNLRQPTRIHAVRLQVGTSYDDPPDHVKRVLLELLNSVAKVLRDPAPVVYLKAYADFAINYELEFYLDDYDQRLAIEDDVLSRIWYAFRREGIEIPFPIQTSYEFSVPLEERSRKGQVDVAGALERVVLFSSFDAEERARLAASTHATTFAPGERVLRQGEPGDTLYAIVRGAARVTIDAGGGVEREVARLSSGEVFGEMSLLTGAPRAASVWAVDGLVLVAVSKAALLPLVTSNPTAAEKMAEVVTLRKLGLDEAQSMSTLDSKRRAEMRTERSNLASRIRRFFGLAG
jgi:small-conductance mechanosensitive channel/CRP-like cAMP-binding protein